MANSPYMLNRGDINLSIERVCAYCKSKEPNEKYTDKNKPIEKMIIDLNNADHFVCYNKLTYHKKCFENVISNKRKKLSEDEILLVLKDSKTHIKQGIVSNELFQFMLENYNLTVIGSSVFQKLSSIYNGTYRGMSVGIPITDLLDMWQRKIKLLNKIASQNNTKGKKMDGNERILYDLSVLINKYDSYLKWKREQEILQLQSNENENHLYKNKKINFNLIERQIKNSDENKVGDNIDDLLDEIF